MMDMLARGNWADVKDRQPGKYGKYRVLCTRRGQVSEDEYLWNGSYWVTPRGNVSSGVLSWWDEEADQAEEKPRTGTEMTEAGTEMTEAGQAGTAARPRTLAEYETRIAIYKEQIGTGFIGIGRTLIEAKEAGVVPHGEWESWMTRTTGLTTRQAQRCMQAAREIRDGSALARLEMSKALLLLSSGLEEEEKEDLARKAAEEGSTLKALQEEVRRLKLQVVQETGVSTEMKGKLERVQAERDSVIQQIRATQEAYQKRMDEETEKAYRRGASERDLEAEKEIRKQYQDRIDFINRERASMADTLKDTRERLKDAQAEGSRQFDEGFRRGRGELEESRQEYERQIGSLREELEKQKEQGEELRASLLHAENNRVEVEPADYQQLKRNQADLLAAAEDAENRAMAAEAELERLRAGDAGRTEEAWKVLKVALERFMADVEFLPMDPAGLRRGRAQISASLGWLESWAKMMHDALEKGPVAAEGAVV